MSHFFDLVDKSFIVPETAKRESKPAEYIMRNAGLDEAQAGIKMPGEISITSDMQMTPPLWQKVKRNSKAS